MEDKGSGTPRFGGCDPPERIKQCLRCEKDECNDCLVYVHRRRYLDQKGATAMWENGYNDKEIARALRVKPYVVYQWRKRNQLPINDFDDMPDRM